MYKKCKRFSSKAAVQTLFSPFTLFSQCKMHCRDIPVMCFLAGFVLYKSYTINMCIVEKEMFRHRNRICYTVTKYKRKAIKKRSKSALVSKKSSDVCNMAFINYNFSVICNGI